MFQPKRISKHRILLFYFIIPSSSLIIQTPYFTIIQIQRFSVFSFPVQAVHMSTVPQSTALLSTMVKSFNALLDSGCTNYIVQDRALFHDYVEKSFSVSTANCGSLDALDTGDVEFHYPFGDRYVIFTLRGCLYAPTAPINLLSIYWCFGRMGYVLPIFTWWYHEGLLP